MSKRIHVVAAVIKDGQNNIFIAKRPNDKHQGGLWEFPGGKVEAGETNIQALKRELHEEIGIDVLHAEPLITISHDYPDKSVLLDVWTVDTFRGTAHGKENQDTQWISIDQLRNVEFPAANHPIVSAASLPNFYAITHEPRDDDEYYLELDNICKQGIKLIQIRFKQPYNDTIFQKARHIASQYGTRILLNADTPVSDVYGGDGRHLTSRQLNQLDERPIGKELLLGASCHNLEEIRQAEAIDVDFIVLAPVLKTRSHPEAPPLGWDSFQSLVESAKVPTYALGGLNKKDLQKAKLAGAQGLAGIRLFSTQNDGV